MAKLVCPECRKRLRIPFFARGSKVRCPGCRHVFRKDIGRRLAKMMDEYKPGLSRRARVAVCVAGAGVLAVGAVALILVYVGGGAPDPRAPLRPQAAAEAPSPEQLFAAASPAVVQVHVTDRSFGRIAQASGFFVRPKGLLLTNFHVIDEAAFACVKLQDGPALPVAGLVAADPQADLALLQVLCEDQPFLRMAREMQPRVGMRVYVLGNPRGLANSLSEGLISGLRTKEGRLHRIQFTAAVSPGSSGGPVLTQSAEVIGIACSVWREGQLLNFAVPAARAAALLDTAGVRISVLPNLASRLPTRDVQKMTQAWMAYVEKDYDRTLDLLNEVQDVHLSGLDLWLARGEAYLADGRPQSALTQFRRAAHLRTDCSQAHAGIGKAHLMGGQWEQAADAFRKAIDTKAESPGVYLYAGMAFARAKRYPEAVGALRTAIDKHPASGLAAQALAELEKIPSGFK